MVVHADVHGGQPKSRWNVSTLISGLLDLNKFMTGFKVIRLHELMGRWCAKRHVPHNLLFDEKFEPNVSFRLSKTLLIISPHHKLDQKNCLTIQRVLSSRPSLPYSAILFDLSRVTAIDSVGLGLILFVAHSQRRKKRPTHVAGPQTHVLELLKKAKLTEMVTIAEH